MITACLTPFAANVVQSLYNAGVLETGASMRQTVSFLKNWSPPNTFRPEFSGGTAFDAVESFHRSLSGNGAEVPQPVEDAFEFFNAVRSHRLHELVAGKTFHHRLKNYYETVADALLQGVLLMGSAEEGKPVFIGEPDQVLGIGELPVGDMEPPVLEGKKLLIKP